MTTRIILNVIAFFFISIGINAQEFQLSSELEKSKSITAAQVLDPGFDDNIVFWMRQGTTIFNQKGVLVSLDKNTLEVRKKVRVEKGTDLKNIWTDDAYTMNKKVLIPSFVKEDSKISFYFQEVDNDLGISPIKKVYSENSSKPSQIKIKQNEEKDLLTVSYIVKPKGEKKENLHYFVIDSDLKVVTKNVISNPKRLKNSDDKGSFIVFNDGIIYDEFNDNSLNVVNVRTNEEVKVSFEQPGYHQLTTARKISNKRVIISGAWANADDEDLDAVFRAEIDLEAKKIINYKLVMHTAITNLPQKASLSNIQITETGNVYFLTCEYIRSDAVLTKKGYQLYYIDKNSKSWIKELPIPKAIFQRNMGYAHTIRDRVFLNGESFAIVYCDSKKAQEFDLNGFDHTKTKLSLLGKSTITSPKNNIMSIMQIDGTGNASRKSFTPPRSKYVNGTFAANQGKFYSPVRFVSGMTYGPSAVLEIKY